MITHQAQPLNIDNKVRSIKKMLPDKYVKIIMLGLNVGQKEY